MVNLIPPSAKRSVTLEYWLRVLTVWSLIAAGVALLFTLTFLPVYVLVETKIDAYQESAEIASQKIASFQAVSAELTVATQQARLLMVSTNETSLYEIIELFDSLENNGIELNQITASKIIGGGIEPVLLSGTALNRQSLADFRDRLLEQPSVETVDFPISNLAKDRDINFAITVTMSNENTI